MDDPRIKQLEQELDYAINQARMLRGRLEALAPAPSEFDKEQQKQRLHGVLDLIQRATPAFLRALVRQVYLKYFYYRIYPEYSPRAVLTVYETPLNPLAAHSGYPPFLEFKRQLCRELNMDSRGVSIACEPGLVSVVLPVHNGARFVAEAIESALAQTYSNFELIVVDDGSTDETPEILGRYADHPKVRSIRQQNRKLPAALNTGFSAARGEFFTWISDDNRMHPGMLAELTGFLQEHAYVEMVYADEELIDERGAAALRSDFCPHRQSPPGSNILRRQRDPGELNFVQDNLIGGCFLYRAWAAKIVGEYSGKCFGFEDYEYWMRMNALFRIAHLAKPDILYSYRLHSQSLTSRERELSIADRARYFTLVEAERRKFFVQGFDITFIGKHPWFTSLTRAFRRSGHNVMEIPRESVERRYRYEMTRAFPKSIAIGGSAPAGEHFAVLRENRLILPGLEMTATSSASIEYPLLALANSVLWSQKECPNCPESH